VNTPVLTNTSLDTSIPSENDLEEIKQLKRMKRNSNAWHWRTL